MPYPEEWTKSSYSNPNGSCVQLKRVEIKPGDTLFLHTKAMGQTHLWLMRDSVNPMNPPLVFTDREIEAFFRGVRAGEFGNPGNPGSTPVALPAREA